MNPRFAPLNPSSPCPPADPSAAATSATAIAAGPASATAGRESRMAGLLSETCSSSKGKLDSSTEHDSLGLYSRKELEETPSRRDGISSMKEKSLRKSYCAYLLNLGKRLKVPQFTIATAIVLCHRFFLLQSHAKNDRWTIATSCMFLAGKVDGGLYPLRDIIPLYYETIYKKDPFAAQKIRQKEVYEEQKQLILLGERIVLVTLGFNLIVDHPYKPLQDIVQKFKSENISIVQVAWNLINDGLWSLSWLQFEPLHIAAGAIFLASKFLKVKLSFNCKNRWWLELGMSTWQLKVVSNQLLILYEEQSQAHPPPPHRKRVDASSVRTNDKQPTRKIMATVEEKGISTSHHPSQAAPNNVGESSLTGQGNQCVPHYEHAANPTDGLNLVESQSADLWDQKESGGASQGNFFVVKVSTFMERGQNEGGYLKEGNTYCAHAMKNSPTKKVKVVLKKQRKNHGEAMARKLDPMDANDIVEKERENETEMSKHQTRLQKSTPSSTKMYYDAPANIGQAKHIQGDLCERSVYWREGPNRQGYGTENYRKERKLLSPLDDPGNIGCKRKAHGIPPRRDGRGHSFHGRLPQHGHRQLLLHV